MSCRFAHDDAAYVLGALSPRERLDFERHLASCDECTRSVRDFAGLPGLLGGVESRVVEHLESPPDEPVPATVLPQLSRMVNRARRRRTVVTIGSAAAAALLTIGAVASQLGGPAGDTGATAERPSPAARSMAPVGDAPVHASLALEEVTWGTRLGLVCTYDPSASGAQLPPEVDYLLFVRTRDGRTEQVGSWRSVEGLTMQVSAATAASRDDIAAVEVRAPDGRVVLTLAA